MSAPSPTLVAWACAVARVVLPLCADPTPASRALDAAEAWAASRSHVDHARTAAAWGPLHRAELRATGAERQALAAARHALELCAAGVESTPDLAAIAAARAAGYAWGNALAAAAESRALLAAVWAIPTTPLAAARAAAAAAERRIQGRDEGEWLGGMVLDADAALPWEQAWEPDAETLARHDRAEALLTAHAAVERMAARRECTG